MNILIIEDEYSLAEALKEGLTKEGYRADTALDGRSGLELALSKIYDVILLDIMLPFMDGHQVLRNLRKEKVPSYVIILSAKSELDDRITGLDYGADDYLTKPFHMKELFARIRAVTRRQGEVLEDKLKVGDLWLDLKTFKLSGEETSCEVELGTKEFQVLEYLMRNKGQIISRNQITEKVWGYNSEVEYNNVDVYISFLRKKMKLVGSSAEIRTIRGVGYVVE